jgi:hypothetical protein
MCVFIKALDDEIAALKVERDKYKKRKDEAYEERNRLVALVARMTLAHGGVAGVGVHEDTPDVEWHPEWRTLVAIDLPTGQASWHLHDSHVHLVRDLPAYTEPWDRHTTEVKYERVAHAYAPPSIDSLAGTYGMSPNVARKQADAESKARRSARLDVVFEEDEQ